MLWLRASPPSSRAAAEVRQPGPLAPFSRVPPSSAQDSPIAHVVVIVQENRSFDNLFATFPGADGTTTGLEKVRQGSKYVVKSIALQQSALVMNTDIGHCRYSYLTAYDHGKMDAFNLEPKGVCPRTARAAATDDRHDRLSVRQPRRSRRTGISPSSMHSAIAYSRRKAAEVSPRIRISSAATRRSSVAGASLVDTPTGMPWGCDSSKTARTDLLTTALQFEEDKGPVPARPTFRRPAARIRRCAICSTPKAFAGSTTLRVSLGSPGCGDGCTQCAGALLNAFDVIAPVRNGKEWGTNVSMPQTNIFDRYLEGPAARRFVGDSDR